MTTCCCPSPCPCKAEGGVPITMRAARACTNSARAACANRYDNSERVGVRQQRARASEGVGNEARAACPGLSGF